MTNEPIIPGAATPLERGESAMEATPEEWRKGAEELHGPWQADIDETRKAIAEQQEYIDQRALELHSTIAHVRAGGLGVYVEDCPKCKADGEYVRLRT